METLKEYIDILKTALQRKEPISLIIKNGIKRLTNIQKYYKPKLKLSDDKGYNIYLNKLKETFQPLDFDAAVSFAIITIGEAKKLTKELAYPNINIYTIDHISDIRTLNITEDYSIILEKSDLLNQGSIVTLARHVMLENHPEIVTFDEDIIVDGLRENPEMKPIFNFTYFTAFNFIKNAFCIKTSSLLQLLKELSIESKKQFFFSIILKAYFKELSFTRICSPLISRTKSIDYNLSNEEKHTMLTCDFGLKNIRSCTNGIVKNTTKVNYEIDESRLVSIIIPFRDKVELLKTCIASIHKFTQYSNYEILLADNESIEESTLNYIEHLLINNSNIRHIKCEGEFNFSRINNIAVTQAEGDFLLFMNNDIALSQPGWLKEMIQPFTDKNVGIVGPKLLYADMTVQHAGVIVGMGDVAGHISRHLPDNDDGYMSRANIPQEFNAVTAACLLTTKKIFDSVNGFDEINLAVAYNDIDYCLKVRKAGYKIIYTPYAKMYHHESQSRNYDRSKLEIKRYQKEVKFMREKWKLDTFVDPFFHPAFLKNSESIRFNRYIKV